MRFPVGDLRLADGGFHLEFAQHAVDDDLQMQLAHAGDDGLPGFLIGIGLECRIFFGKLDERHGHLFLAGLGLGLDGHPDDRLGELHGFQDDRMLSRRTACRRLWYP